MILEFLIRRVLKLILTGFKRPLKFNSNKFENLAKRKRRQVLIKRTVDIVDQAKESFSLVITRCRR